MRFGYPLTIAIARPCCLIRTRRLVSVVVVARCGPGNIDEEFAIKRACPPLRETKPAKGWAPDFSNDSAYFVTEMIAGCAFVPPRSSMK